MFSATGAIYHNLVREDRQNQGRQENKHGSFDLIRDQPYLVPNEKACLSGGLASLMKVDDLKMPKACEVCQRKFVSPRMCAFCLGDNNFDYICFSCLYIQAKNSGRTEFAEYEHVFYKYDDKVYIVTVEGLKQSFPVNEVTTEKITIAPYSFNRLLDIYGLKKPNETYGKISSAVAKLGESTVFQEIDDEFSDSLLNHILTRGVDVTDICPYPAVLVETGIFFAHGYQFDENDKEFLSILYRVENGPLKNFIFCKGTVVGFFENDIYYLAGTYLPRRGMNKSDAEGKYFFYTFKGKKFINLAKDSVDNIRIERAFVKGKFEVFAKHMLALSFMGYGDNYFWFPIFDESLWTYSEEARNFIVKDFASFPLKASRASPELLELYEFAKSQSVGKPASRMKKSADRNVVALLSPRKTMLRLEEGEEGEEGEEVKESTTLSPKRRSHSGDIQSLANKSMLSMSPRRLSMLSSVQRENNKPDDGEDAEI